MSLRLAGLLACFPGMKEAPTQFFKPSSLRVDVFCPHVGHGLLDMGMLENQSQDEKQSQRAQS